MIAVYVAWALLWIGGWLAYSSYRGYPFVQGLVLTTAFLVIPFCLVGEGARALHARQIPSGAGALLLGVGLLGYAASGAVARGMLFPGDPYPVPAGLPAGAKRVDYAASDGQRLAGVLVRAEAADAPVLVYFHGNAESAARNLDIGLALRERGCTTFLAEFRGFGGVGGSPDQEGLFLDGEAAISALERELGVSRAQIVVCGRSLGSGVASELAGRGVGRRVVLLSPYTSIRDVASRLAPAPLAWLAVRDPLDSKRALGRREVPVLVFHGDRDQVVPYALGADLVASLGDRAELVTFPGVGHNDLMVGAQGRAILDRWAAYAATQ